MSSDEFLCTCNATFNVSTSTAAVSRNPTLGSGKENEIRVGYIKKARRVSEHNRRNRQKKKEEGSGTINHGIVPMRVTIEENSESNQRASKM